MHSQSSLFHKVQSEKQRTKIKFMGFSNMKNVVDCREISSDEFLIWWLCEKEIVWKEYVDKLFYILHVSFRRWMHSQPSLFRKVHSLQQLTYQNCWHGTLQKWSNIRPTTVGIRTQIVSTATTMANVFADFKATKNLRAKLILLADFSVELSALAIVVSAKIRLRCFRATIKMWKLRKNIKKRGRCPAKASVK